MKLAIEKRTTEKTNKLRREGNIPAIIYGDGEKGQLVHLKSDEMKAILRKLQPGHLATTVFELEGAGKKTKAIIKDVQYHFANYEIEHIDFLGLSEDKPITVNVPIQLVGVADCAGVKLGGFVRQVIRSLKVSCLPKDIPQHFVIDVKDLGLGQSKKLADIDIPSSVKPLAKLGEVAVVVGKKAGT